MARKKRKQLKVGDFVQVWPGEIVEIVSIGKRTAVVHFAEEGMFIEMYISDLIPLSSVVVLLRRL